MSQTSIPVGNRHGLLGVALVWGFLWGSIVAVIAVSSDLTYLEWETHLLRSLILVLLWMDFCLSLLIGSILSETARAIRAAIIALPVALATCYSFSSLIDGLASFPYFFSINLSLILLTLIIAFAGTLIGSVFLSIETTGDTGANWRWLFCALLANTIASISAFPAILLVDPKSIWFIPVATAMGVLVATDWFFAIWAPVRRDPAISRRVVFLTIGTVAVAGLAFGATTLGTNPFNLLSTTPIGTIEAFSLGVPALVLLKLFPGEEKVI